MTQMGGFDIAAGWINPLNLTSLLSVAGWIRRGGRPNTYERWELSEDNQKLSLVVPLDPSRDDYPDLLEEALAALTQSSLPSAQIVVSRLRTPGDEVEWHQESHAASGLISWSLGETLIASAKSILVAAAKAAHRPSAYHGQRGWRFAREYLDKVYMGQTRVGSYIVTAYTPLGQIRETGKPNISSDSEVVSAEISAIRSDPIRSDVTGRDVMSRLTTALDASRESIDHFSRTGSLSGFDEGVERGISYELTRALSTLVKDSEGARISVRWFPAGGTGAPPDAPWKMEFLPDDLPALERASTRLASTEPRRTVVIVGTVTSLSRPRFGSPGTIVLNVIYGASVSRVRVRLSKTDYEHAIAAHKSGDLLRVTGELEKEGNNYWLYQPTELGPVEAGALNQADMFGSIDPDLLRAHPKTG